MAPKFTKQHYEIISRALRSAQERPICSSFDQTSTRYAFVATIFALAEEFNRDNKNFDVRRFWDACRPGEEMEVQ